MTGGATVAKREKIIEQYYPLVGATVVALAGLEFGFDIMGDGEKSLPLITNAITISSIFIGFLGTMAGIILGSNSKAVLFMRRIGKLQPLLRYIWGAIGSSFALLGLSFFLQLVPQKLARVPFFSLIWLFVASLAVLSTHRGIFVTINLLYSIAESDE